MKIGPIDTPLTVAPVAGERKAGTPAGSNAATAGTSATVDISPEATALAAGDGSFDAGKVERISQSIQNGTFKVNPDAIADKLIANAQELLARTYR
jgi:negative regulator of flagellin synthesis FlgM